jgi:hypothetical protein
MASISGKNGSVTFSSGDTYVKSWTLDYNADLYETTNFDDSGYRTYITGFTGWSGSYECNCSTANSAVPGSTGEIVLMSSTESEGSWRGDVYITGMTVNVPVDGLVTQNYTFQGSGALTVNSTGA